MKNNDVIIVGGGLAGLAAAAYLARAKKRVTLYERAHELGGRARTRRDRGFAFNLGGHALYAGGEGIRVLRDLGVRPSGREPSNDGSLAVRSGKLARFPTGMMSLFSTDLFGWSEKIDAAKILSSLARIDAKALRETSVAAWLDETTTKPVVREYIEAAVRVSTYANAPTLASAGRTLEQLRLALNPGVLYLDDGWATLVLALANVARAAGAKIVCGAAVKSIAHDECAQGVVLSDGELASASEIIVAGSPSMLRALLENKDDTANDYASSAIPIHAACLDLALSSLPFPARAFALGIDSPLYFSVHSATAKLAPEGAALVHLMKYLDPMIETDSARDEAELTDMMDLIQPGWRDRVVSRTWLPELVASNALTRAANGGARATVAHPVIAGVHVVGDWVGDGGMLADASLASAREASHAIIRGRSVADSPMHLARGVA